MATNYQQGRQLEYEVVKIFKDAGWEFVNRTAGSHSPFDLFAIKRTHKYEKEVWITVLVQCKTTEIK